MTIQHHGLCKLMSSHLFMHCMRRFRCRSTAGFEFVSSPRIHRVRASGRLASVGLGQLRYCASGPRSGLQSSTARRTPAQRSRSPSVCVGLWVTPCSRCCCMPVDHCWRLAIFFPSLELQKSHDRGHRGGRNARNAKAKDAQRPRKWRCPRIPYNLETRVGEVVSAILLADMKVTSVSLMSWTRLLLLDPALARMRFLGTLNVTPVCILCSSFLYWSSSVCSPFSTCSESECNSLMHCSPSRVRSSVYRRADSCASLCA